MSHSDAVVPGLTITADRLDQLIERNSALLRRGLALHKQYADADEEQEAARDALEKAAEIRGEKPLSFRPKKKKPGTPIMTDH